MKVKKCSLFATLIILLASINQCLAQEVEDTDPTREVVAKSTFLSYKTVKDNFGKKFAKSYFVIQVDIRNEKLDKQFIVQTIDVLVDPNQCRYAKQIDETFKTDECRAIFDKYFYFLNVQQGIRREEVIGTAKADLNRSNRNVGFRLLAFTANMGTVLTGFKGLIGRDGVLGINVLGTTATAAANALFPNTADEKLDNLRNALPTEDIIIKSKESKTFNIFIPTERMFWKDSWKEYIKSPQDSEYEIYKFKAVLKLILLSSATGVLVDNKAPTVVVKSDDSLRRQEEKIRKVQLTEKDIEDINTFSARTELLQKNLASSSIPIKDQATKSLRDILTEFMKVDALVKSEAFKKFVTEPRITKESEGEAILQAIKDLMRNLNNEALENKVMEMVVKFGR